MNVLDEVPHSYSHQRNLELEQIKYKVETRYHEYVDLEIVKLISKVYAFYEEEGYVIMDCPFVPFHIRANIARHVELQNVAKTIMDQAHEQEPRIHVVQNTLKGLEFGSQLGPHNR